MSNGKRIGLTLDGSTVVAHALDYLGNEFSAFNALCSTYAFRWNKQRYPASRNLGSVEALPAFVAALAQAGFIVEPSEAVKAAIGQIAKAGFTEAEQAAQAHYEAVAAPILAKGLQPYPYQRDGVLWLNSRKRGLIGDEMGCVDGDAVIRINRAGKGYASTLRDLYLKFNGLGSRPWRDQTIQTFIRSLCYGELRLNLVHDVLDKGEKKVLLVTLKSGKSIRLTPDHEVCMANRTYVEARGLKVGDEVLTNGKTECVTCGVVKKVVESKYARFRGSCRKCIYRALREKVTWVGGKFKDKDGYIRVSGKHEHHRSGIAGFVYEHILVMEQHLGRKIVWPEQVHHKNEDRSDNRVSNLKVVSPSGHHREHRKHLHLDGSRGGKGGEVRFVPVIDAVKSVKSDGVAHVYDVVCGDPHRNFVANGIVVHNCGKTPQFLLAIPRGGCAMIVCPATLKINEAVEALRWRPDLSPTIFMPTISRSRQDALVERGISVTSMKRWPLPGEVLIYNYESLPTAATIYKSLVEEGAVKSRSIVHSSVEEQTAFLDGSVEARIVQDTFSAIEPGTVLIGDEIHRTKNPKAQVSARWQTLRDAVLATGGSVWGATGTPLFNRPFDLMNVLRNLGLFESAFTSFKDFVKRMGGFEGRYGMEWSGEIEPSVATSLQRVMLRRERESVFAQFPAKRRTDILIEGSSKALALCNQILEATRRSGINFSKEWAENFRNATSKIKDEAATKFLAEIAGTVDFEVMSRLRAELAAAALPAVLEEVESYEEAGEPLVVFSAHREPVEALGRREGWGSILGGTDTVERARTIESFQAGRLKGIALTIGAGKEGITLTRACHMIFVDLSWNPSDNVQAEDRIHRIGQERPVLIKRILVDHPLIGRVVELLTWKQQMHDTAIKAATIHDSLSAHRSSEAEAALQAIEHGERLSAEEAAHRANEQEKRDALKRDRDEAWEKVRADRAKRIHEHEERQRVLSGGDDKVFTPRTPREEWMVWAIQELTRDDPDFAAERNSVGFNKGDSYLGHALSEMLAKKGGLTQRQYNAIEQILPKYHAQIGRMP